MEITIANLRGLYSSLLPWVVWWVAYWANVEPLCVLPPSFQNQIAL